jgi:hypothetical protein
MILQIKAPQFMGAARACNYWQTSRATPAYTDAIMIIVVTVAIRIAHGFLLTKIAPANSKEILRICKGLWG